MAARGCRVWCRALGLRWVREWVPVPVQQWVPVPVQEWVPVPVLEWVPVPVPVREWVHA